MTWMPEDRLIIDLLFNSENKELLRTEIENRQTASNVNLNWEYIIQTSLREGVSSVIYHNIKKGRLHEYIPDHVYGILSNRYYDTLKRNLSITGELKGALTLLKEAKIPCIVLKGISLAEHVYPGIALRGMSDVDILIKKADLYITDKILSSQGYLPRDSSADHAIYNPEGYLASLEYRRDGDYFLNLHIHWHTVNSSVPAYMFARHIDMERIWEKAVTTRVADVDVQMMCPEHLIIYLCEHALRIGHSFDRLILVCDIYYAVKTYEDSLDWGFLIEESRRFGVDRFIYFSLSIVKHYSSLNVPDEVMRILKPDNISPGERFFLRQQFNNRRVRGSSYFIYLAMNRSYSEKFAFLFRTFFPPSQILLQRQYAKDSKFAGSYYILRIREIFSHLSRYFHCC